MRRRRFDAPRGEDGFTILELVVALALIAVVAVGFTVSIGLGYRTIAVARQRTTASEIATARLEHLRHVPYELVALSSAPSHNADVEHPDYLVSADGSQYDVNGEAAGGLEDLIVDVANGDVLHLEDPVQIGSTVMEIYQYATWVDDPDIAGTQDYRRLTVIVRYKAPAANGVNKILRSSTLITPGTVTVGTPGSSTTTTAPSSTTTSSTAPSGTTSTTSGACASDSTAPTGSFTIGASGESEAGFTATPNISLQLSFTDACGPIVASFSNDGVTWGADVTYDATSPQISWSLTSGNGTKTVYGTVRDGAGNTRSLPPASVTLDATAPTAPASVTRTASCSGSNRTVVLSWGASTDAEGNLRGYRVYRSTDGTTWTELGTTASRTWSDTHSKTLSSTRFYVVAYDRAGNVSAGAPDPVVSLTKNQCT